MELTSLLTTGGVGGDQLDVAVASSLTTINEGDVNFVPLKQCFVRGSWNSYKYI